MAWAQYLSSGCIIQNGQQPDGILCQPAQSYLNFSKNPLPQRTQYPLSINFFMMMNKLEEQSLIKLNSDLGIFRLKASMSYMNSVRTFRTLLEFNKTFQDILPRVRPGLHREIRSKPDPAHFEMGWFSLQNGRKEIRKARSWLSEPTRE